MIRIAGISILFTVIALSVSCHQKTANENKQPPKKIVPDSVSRILPVQPVNPYSPVDVSPMDMTYFPVDYPKLKMTGQVKNMKPFARVIYSRPHLQGRHIFHEVLKYGEPWRMGANEATELELYKDASIKGETIKAGRYTLYCIPQPKEWTIVFNSNNDSWGLQQDVAKDIARFTVPVKETGNSLEYYTMIFEGNGNSASLLMAWDNVEIRLPFTF